MILEIIGFVALYIVLHVVLARFNKGVWVLPIYALIVTLWYRPVIDHFTLLILIFAFVTAALAEGSKRLGSRALTDTLSKKDAESKFEDISDSLTELRDKLRCLDFVPYSVSIGVDCGASKLWALLQSVGFCNGKEWINGVKLGEAKPGYELRRGIGFQVLSSDQYGDPHLVYRTDGKAQRFQSGLDELKRTIEEFTFEDVKGNLDPESEKAFRALSGPKHPVLCFGRLLPEASDTYQIAIEVDEDWWKNISDKPEAEFQIVRKGDEHGPYASIYLVLARIPRRAIHGEESADFWTREPVDGHKAQLEALGWTFLDRGHLQHKFVSISRRKLDGKSSVRGWWDSA